MLHLNKLMIAGGVILSTLSFSPLVYAQAVGIGGMAGSAAFDASTAGKINGVGTAAAIGKNGAGSWSFNDSTATDLNSAGAAGNAGTTSFAPMTAGTVNSVTLGADTTAGLANAQTNTAIGGPDLQLQTVPEGTLVDTTP